MPNDAPARTIDDLRDLRLATTHPNATRRFFGERGIPVEVVTISGAVEVAPRMGLADGIVDLVSSGSTLIMNGLRSVGRAVRQPGHSRRAPPGRAAGARGARIEDVETMLASVIAGRRRKYLMMNAPVTALEAIERILPGLDSPSILPLAHEGMVAVHAVVAADEVWGLLGRLRNAGASGILVVPIEKLLP